MDEQTRARFPIVAAVPTPKGDGAAPGVSTSLTILDVGHGNCAILRDTRGVLVIDAGVRNTLLEYLLQERITQIDTVILSHADADHISGLTALLAAGSVEIRQVVINSDSVKQSALFDDLAYELSQRHDRGELKFVPAIVPDWHGIYDIGEVAVEILAPSGYLAVRGPGSMDRSGKTLTSNSVSAVVRMVHPAFGAVLFAGDLEWRGLESILGRPEAASRMNARLLVFPHHGGRPGDISRTREFVRELLRVVSPEIIVFSIGRGRYSTPRPELVDEIRQQTPAVWIACTQLSKNCKDEVPSVEPGHLLPVVAAGRSKRTCCAGTIVVEFQQVAQVRPVRAQHRQFVQQVVPGGLCLRQANTQAQS